MSTESKKTIFERADYFWACANDPAFDGDEQTEFACKLDALIDLMDALSIKMEWLGVA